MGTGNYSATSNNNIWSVYTGRWWVGCNIWYSNEGTGQGRNPPRPLLAVPNVTAHPSTASVPITVLLYNDPLLCGFDVPTKGLTMFLTVAQASLLRFLEWITVHRVLSNCSHCVVQLLDVVTLNMSLLYLFPRIKQHFSLYWTLLTLLYFSYSS